MELSRAFYERGVRPLLEHDFPNLQYSAALIGSGSEVLGFDTPRSSDHHWGPRVMLFLHEEDLARHRDQIHQLMATELPRNIDGYPTNFTPPQEDGSQLLEEIERGSINHRVEMYTVAGYIAEYTGLADPFHLSEVDWLVTPQQRLRSLTAGAVFHDGLNVLNPMRAALRWYPDHLWRALLAAQWRRIGQEEPFPGRCAEAGDDLGSRVVTARLVRDMMLLAFLIERIYAPYSKWLGTAFSRLRCVAALQPDLSLALAATSWPVREEAMVGAYRTLARMHNDLHLTDPLPVEPTHFYSRPFRVIHGGSFADALCAGFDSPLLRIAGTVGAIDQWADSTDVLSYPERYRSVVSMYAERQ